MCILFQKKLRFHRCLISWVVGQQDYELKCLEIFGYYQDFSFSFIVASLKRVLSSCLKSGLLKIKMAGKMTHL